MTRVAAVLIFTVGAAGCSTPPTDEQHRSSRPEGRVRKLTAAEEALIDRAERLLVKECMERAGFRYWITGATSATERKAQGYVLDDIGWAKTYGYGGRLMRKAEAVRRNGPNASYANALRQEERIRYRTALDGEPSSGTLSVALPGGGMIQTPRESCHTRAKEQLYGDFESWFRAEKVATNLTPLYVSDILKDKRFVRALETWSGCMSEKGHDYRTPAEIRVNLPMLTRGLSDTAAHAAEVRLAVDEVTCAKMTSLPDTARAIEDEYRAKRTRQYREEIATYQRMRLAATARAKDVVGETP
ncbi:hypothetical protein [Streptomyces albidochromogenes]|uniref:Lipoprotein n=1 Tax=Streptomyces albidochromogenes TaxID=329524 RepID=A0ABW6FIA8_9ACTN